MSNNVKNIKIENHTQYIFDDIINIKDFDANNIKMDEKSYKNVIVYCIAYVTIKDSKYVKTNSVNLYTLCSTKQMDTLKKLIKISIKHQFLQIKAKKK